MAETKKSSSTWYAVTEIQHGTVDDDLNNSVTVFAAGDKVSPSDFDDKDQWDALVQAGSVSHTDPSEPVTEYEETPEAQVEQSVTEVLANMTGGSGAPQAGGSELDAGEGKK